MIYDVIDRLWIFFFNCFIKFCSLIFTYLPSISYCIQYFYLPVYLLLRIGNEKSVHFIYFPLCLKKSERKHQLIRFFSLLRSYHNDQGGFLYEKQTNFLLHLLFVFYLAALTWIILFKMAVSFDTIDHGIRSLNLIPFKGAMITNGRINFSEMIDNILVFCPFGIYIGVLYRRWNLSEKVLSFFSA